MTSLRLLLPINPIALASFALAAATALGCSDDGTSQPQNSTSSSSSSSSSSSGGQGGSGGESGSGGKGGAAGLGGDRPVDVFVPSSYAAGTPMPLLILLHGYGANGDIQESYFRLQALAESRGFLYAHPDGNTNSQDDQFWNATDACCDYEQTSVDDSGYLRQIIDDIKASYTVDPKRVFFVGHSNGGFMSYRMACEHADTIAAIATLAGAMPLDVSLCDPTSPVAVLQIHGTNDELIFYEGGDNIAAAYPAAATTVGDWVTINGCSSTPTTGPTRDLESAIAGSETTSQIYGDCEAGGHVEFWTIAGGRHIPQLNANFGPAVLDFLFAHPKP